MKQLSGIPVILKETGEIDDIKKETDFTKKQNISIIGISVDPSIEQTTELAQKNE